MVEAIDVIVKVLEGVAAAYGIYQVIKKDFLSFNQGYAVDIICGKSS